MLASLHHHLSLEVHSVTTVGSSLQFLQHLKSQPHCGTSETPASAKKRSLFQSSNIHNPSLFSPALTNTCFPSCYVYNTLMFSFHLFGFLADPLHVGNQSFPDFLCSWCTWYFGNFFHRFLTKEIPNSFLH